MVLSTGAGESARVFGGASGVGYYRLYLLSGAEGSFVGIKEIEAPDDVEALKAARDHVGTHPLELWCGKRRVKAIPAQDSGAATFAG